jgi:hypothetical protein
MFTLWRPITGSVHYFIFRGQDGGIINTGRWMWLTLIEGGIRHKCWWRGSPKPSQNEPSTTATHMNIHQNSVSDTVVDEPRLKIPNRVHQLQTTKQVSNGWGRGWTPTNKELWISLSLLWGLFQSKNLAQGLFTSGTVQCELVRVPYIIWKVLSYFYIYCSFFRFWRVSDVQIFEGSLCKQRVYLLTLVQFFTDCIRSC